MGWERPRASSASSTDSDGAGRSGLPLPAPPDSDCLHDRHDREDQKYDRPNEGDDSHYDSTHRIRDAHENPRDQSVQKRYDDSTDDRRGYEKNQADLLQVLLVREDQTDGAEDLQKEQEAEHQLGCGSIEGAVERHVSGPPKGRRSGQHEHDHQLDEGLHDATERCPDEPERDEDGDDALDPTLESLTNDDGQHHEREREHEE